MSSSRNQARKNVSGQRGVRITSHQLMVVVAEQARRDGWDGIGGGDTVLPYRPCISSKVRWLTARVLRFTLTSALRDEGGVKFNRSPSAVSRGPEGVSQVVGFTKDTTEEEGPEHHP